MGILARLGWSFDVLSSAADEAGPAFAVDETAIDPAVFGLTSYASPVSPAPRIDRKAAIQVGAVKRSRDLIAGGLGGLPLVLLGPDKRPAVMTLLEQPERNVARSVTMTRTVEDLLFEQIAWWRITEFNTFDYPKHVERVHPQRVNVADEPKGCPSDRLGCSGAVAIDGKHVHDQDVIRFDSPNDGLLTAAARAIRTCLSLDAAVSRYADEPVPTGWFTPKHEDVEPEPTEVEQLLTDWQTARQRRATAYVPSALDYKTAAFSPEQLQLADQRNAAVLEIARHAGIDPEEVGVAVTSRTYSNQFDRRKSFTDFTLGNYRNAIQDRLSMGDVTPPRYVTRFDLDEFLRSDPASFYAAVQAGVDVGAIDPSEVRDLTGRPPLATVQPRTPQEATAMSADFTSRGPALAFEDGPELRLDAPGAQTFEVDRERRIIRGMAVPYGGKIAESNGRRFRFHQGTLDFSEPSRSKMWVHHDKLRAVGVLLEADDRPAGMFGTWKIARGAAGDEALSMAEDGVWDGLSVGIAKGGKFTLAPDGVYDAVKVPWMETSLTPAPAFADARVHSVAASADTEGNIMPDAPVLEAAPAADFSALASTLTDAIRDGFAGLTTPQAPAVPGRETVSAGGSFEVREELPYRFSGSRGEHSLIDDLRSMASGDAGATQRLETFMDEAAQVFAVTTGNVSSLNPTPSRPELYVPNLTYTTPLQDAVSTGTLEDKTSFTVPKFSSATGLVAAHVEGVEPTAGAFTATSQTVNPGALSGKIQINREVWDQGGSPQADAIIWGEMLNAWYEAREARIATLLNGLSLTEINLGGAVNGALVTALQNVFIDLQYVRGGNRYTSAVADGSLFKAMANAEATDGRKLLPILGPTNAQGATDPGFSAIAVGSTAFRAAWALGATNASNSYLFVPTSVWQWASTPKKFTFEYQVATIDMAIWGYEANACLRDSDVKRIDYTTADV